ncbi:cilia- and flagella-associated protein 119 [Aplochiton taeniatus]
MEEIDNINSIPELESALCRVLRVDVPEPRKGVLLELYVHTVLFCRESKFNNEQTSALLSIIKNVHQANTGRSNQTPLNNMDHCFEYCRELLLCHSVMHPPFSINLFNSEELTQITKYLLNSYIRHYNLYKYIFTPQIRLDLTVSYSEMTDDEPEGVDSVTSGT